jgi:hypothetical protein
VFLVSAIGVTLWEQQSDAATSGALIPDVNTLVAIPEFEGVVTTEVKLTRAERVAIMRSKIAAAPQLTAPEVVIPAEEQVINDLATSSVATAVLCANYAPYRGFWDARALAVAQSEGAILISQTVQEINGSSSIQTLVQLPARVLPNGTTACIGSDVIGIANDGSLIRNDEVGLYGLFGSDTRIGYALDGFPIYGTGPLAVDNCGGRVAGGQYRYELQNGSATILNCFAATPVTLP